MAAGCPSACLANGALRPARSLHIEADGGCEQGGGSIARAPRRRSGQTWWKSGQRATRRGCLLACRGPTSAARRSPRLALLSHHDVLLHYMRRDGRLLGDFFALLRVSRLAFPSRPLLVTTFFFAASSLLASRPPPPPSSSFPPPSPCLSNPMLCFCEEARRARALSNSSFEEGASEAHTQSACHWLWASRRHTALKRVSRRHADSTRVKRRRGFPGQQGSPPSSSRLPVVVVCIDEGEEGAATGSVLSLARASTSLLLSPSISSRRKRAGLCFRGGLGGDEGGVALCEGAREIFASKKPGRSTSEARISWKFSLLRASTRAASWPRPRCLGSLSLCVLWRVLLPAPANAARPPLILFAVVNSSSALQRILFFSLS